MEQRKMMEALFAGIDPAMKECGFTADKTNCEPYAASPVYDRGESTVLDYLGEGNNGRVRFVFGTNKIHLLLGAADADLGDDSAFKMDATYLFILEEYGDKDVKSLVNEISDYMRDTYLSDQNREKKAKKIATVSKTAARKGALAYDPVTLASKLAGMYPELKQPMTDNIAEYGEFLCEDFFVNYGNAPIVNTIRYGDQQKMKRLFNILGEVYEDGTNEVQSVIAVTIIGSLNNDPELMQKIIPYLTDTMLEPVLAAAKKLGDSKTARMRLENPPKYKPKKQKKGLMSQLMSGGARQ